ncbi:porin family protein [Gammaproteobacteria bacterium]|nr:porin family protein [Gammaproteobacteria bacterium]
MYILSKKTMKPRAFFLMICIFLCMHSYAQNVEPTISDPKELSAALQQKEEVFKQLFKDPTNLSLLFKYANLSIMVGDLEGAIGVFEQMLIYDSELPRIRLELGVLYFRLGAFALANNYLKSVKEYNPPPEVEARVDQFLEAIVSAEEPFQWQQTLSIGFKRTTNGNSGINADFIEIGDFLLDVDPESQRQSDRSSLYNYSLSIDQDLNHPRGDNIQYFFSYGADRLDTFKQFDVQSNVFSVRRNFNLDENFFSFFNLEDPVFAPNINLLRVVLNRQEILRSGRISLDYSGQLDNGSSMLFTYYREEKIFRSGRQKNGRINGVSFGQSYVWAGSQALYGYRVILENYRASAGYEFYENYGLELSYSQPLGENWQFSSKYSYQDKSHDDEYPLFGARHDQAESWRFNMLRPLGACWSMNLGLVLNDSRSTISIYKRRANNFSAQINYQCLK